MTTNHMSELSRLGINRWMKLLALAIVLSIAGAVILLSLPSDTPSKQPYPPMSNQQTPPARAPITEDSITKASFGSLQNPNKP